MANRGLMAENMFIGQAALLQWLNGTLSLRLEKIEETASGAVACQLMDCLHPGSVNMKKVDFNVRNDWEYVNNYKELQQSFNKMKVDRAFNVNQLSKGKRQDSIEFMQWFKGYWDAASGGEDLASQYDAVGRRQLCKTGDWKKFSTGASSTRPKQAPQARIAAVKSKNAVRTATTVNNAAKIKAVNPPPAVDPEMEAKLNALVEEVTELKLKIDTAERERDFYFDKLRDIEIMCQSPELADIPVLRVVEKVLYAVDSEEAKAVMAEAQEELGAQLLCGEEPAHMPQEEAEEIAPIQETV